MIDCYLMKYANSLAVRMVERLSDEVISNEVIHSLRNGWLDRLNDTSCSVQISEHV